MPLFADSRLEGEIDDGKKVDVDGEILEGPVMTKKEMKTDHKSDENYLYFAALPSLAKRWAWPLLVPPMMRFQSWFTVFYLSLN